MKQALKKFASIASVVKVEYGDAARCIYSESITVNISLFEP